MYISQKRVYSIQQTLAFIIKGSATNENNWEFLSIHLCTMKVIQPFLHPVNASYVSYDNLNSSKFLNLNYSSRFQKAEQLRSIDPKDVFSFILHSIFYMFSNIVSRSLASPMHTQSKASGRSKSCFLNGSHLGFGVTIKGNQVFDE